MKSQTTSLAGKLTDKQVGLVMAFKIGRIADNKFEYDDKQFAVWSKQIEKDYPDLSPEKLEAIMWKGFKGCFRDKYEMHTTFSTIIRWINTFLKDEKEAEEARLAKEHREDCDAGMKHYMNLRQYRAWRDAGFDPKEKAKYQEMKFKEDEENRFY